ncbi:hypothetical protein DFH27DRAFT_648445 [Peziza echinospora]|nr:hypothetical protein DFH27DRAFT_648445 [Peziza echinospora]
MADKDPVMVILIRQFCLMKRRNSGLREPPISNAATMATDVSSAQERRRVSQWILDRSKGGWNAHMNSELSIDEGATIHEVVCITASIDWDYYENRNPQARDWRRESLWRCGWPASGRIMSVLPELAVAKSSKLELYEGASRLVILTPSPHRVPAAWAARFQAPPSRHHRPHTSSPAFGPTSSSETFAPAETFLIIQLESSGELQVKHPQDNITLSFLENQKQANDTVVFRSNNLLGSGGQPESDSIATTRRIHANNRLTTSFKVMALGLNWDASPSLSHDRNSSHRYSLPIHPNNFKPTATTKGAFLPGAGVSVSNRQTMQQAVTQRGMLMSGTIYQL